MTYPQAAASEFVKNGGEFWRLNTLLASPGDIYESDESLLALAVGPNSDISRVNVSYYDKTIPSSAVENMIISPDRAFTGRLASRLDQPYPLTPLLKGRILVSSADVWDPTYLPVTVTQNDVVTRVVPRLDVVGYFDNVPSLIPQRSDYKFYQTSFVPPAGTSYSWLVVPYYGRKYACVSLRNYSGNAVTYQLRGVRYTTVSNEQDETVIVAAAAVASGATNVYRVRASADGMFDALVLGVQKSGAGNSLFKIYTTVYMSDDPL